KSKFIYTSQDQVPRVGKSRLWKRTLAVRSRSKLNLHVAEASDVLAGWSRNTRFYLLAVLILLFAARYQEETRMTRYITSSLVLAIVAVVCVLAVAATAQDSVTV